MAVAKKSPKPKKALPTTKVGMARHLKEHHVPKGSPVSFSARTDYSRDHAAMHKHGKYGHTH